MPNPLLRNPIYAPRPFEKGFQGVYTSVLSGVMTLSRVQEKIVTFIRRYLHQHGYAPSIRDIMHHCGFKSPRAVSFHLEKLERGGVIQRDRKARSILLNDLPSAMTIPVFGTIPAGFPETVAEDRKTLGELAIQPGWFGVGMRRGGYALRVRGDSMQDVRIFDGDLAIVEPRAPKAGDIVVAIIDGENTLKRLVRQKDKYFLRAENPKYPELIPTDELKVQGVVVGIYRSILS